MEDIFYDRSDVQERVSQRGQQSSLVKSFGIKKLYGYRNISLASDYAATILIAKNGTGKTTLLGALDAFLRLQFHRLRNLEFEEIFCRLSGVEEEITLTHDDLIAFLQTPREGEIAKLAGRASATVEELFAFLQGDYKKTINEYYSRDDQNKLVAALLQNFGYDLSRVIHACDEAYFSLFQRSGSLLKVWQTLRTAMENYDIVYLPTYRRVELALTDDKDSRRLGRRKRPQFTIASGSLHTGDIQFGLSDISDRLTELNRDIVVRSNLGYREISENIINELIQGFEVSEGTPIPAPEDLKLFFSRMESGSRMIGPYYPISAPDFAKIYSGEGIPPDSRKFLAYFLGKLANVISITKEIEQPVEEFVAICNKYLSSNEPSTDLYDRDLDRHLDSIDAKALRMDRSDLSVAVESLRSNDPISLDALSSGEKQMISLFAKLYLYPKRKLVLIDEPELSLSIDWQREILVDVLLSPNCEQVIAITHSPFVFDNALESFARTLSLKVDRAIDPQLRFGGEHNS